MSVSPDSLVLFEHSSRVNLSRSTRWHEGRKGGRGGEKGDRGQDREGIVTTDSEQHVLDQLTDR